MLQGKSKLPIWEQEKNWRISLFFESAVTLNYSSLHMTLPLPFLDHVFEFNIGLRLLNNHCMD